MKQFSQNGPSYLFQGLSLIFQKGIKRYTLIPLLLSTLLFIFLWWYALHEISLLVGNLINYVPHWLSWLNWIIYILSMIILLFFSTYLYITISLLIASPFYSFLSEAVQQKLTNQPVGQPVTARRLLTMIPTSIAREFRKLLSFIPWVLIILICHFIPVINLFTGALWLIFFSWFNVVQYTDYAFDNNEISFPMMKHTLGQHKVLSFSFGFVTTCLLMVPLLNILIIPAAVAGTTKMYVDHWSSPNKPSLETNVIDQ